MRNLERQELYDIVYGAAIYGTGGGGSFRVGLQLIDDSLAQGKVFRMADFDELDDADMIGTPYSCGAISPIGEEDKKKYARLPDFEKEHYNMALEQMERFLGKPVKACISTELGGGNTAKAMYVAATAGKYIMDADAAGRSVPALQHSTYCIYHVPIYPISVMNQFGEGAVFTRVCDDERAEDLVRALAMASQNHIAVVDHINTAAVLKNAVIRGALSQAEKVGRAYRLAVAAGKDYAREAAAAGGGCMVFRGVVESNDWGTVGGYTVGTRIVSGTGDYVGHVLKIWYQNENIIAWLDDIPWITAPDLICLFDEEETVPLLNPYGDAGRSVSVICLPAPAAWVTPRGLELFSPRFFGFDVDYRPFFD
ncbi:MAG: DUF917 domain-containing protein [Clostridiales bacterium]|nr:DUF917 domain-containing protein [Clostridiales bacterium]